MSIYYTTNRAVRFLLGSRASAELDGATLTEAVRTATAEVKGALGRDMVAKVDALQSGSTDEDKSDSTPETIRAITGLIAAHYVILATQGGNLTPEQGFVSGYEKGARMLKEIVDGKRDIAEVVSKPFQIESNTSGYQPTFAEDDPVQWEVDSDREDAIADDRDA